MQFKKKNFLWVRFFFFPFLFLFSTQFILLLAWIKEMGFKRNQRKTTRSKASSSKPSTVCFKYRRPDMDNIRRRIAENLSKFSPSGCYFQTLGPLYNRDPKFVTERITCPSRSACLATRKSHMNMLKNCGLEPQIVKCPSKK